METFIFCGVTIWFVGSGGYVFNFRKRYVMHKQKRIRSKILHKIENLFECFININLIFILR